MPATLEEVRTLIQTSFPNSNIEIWEKDQRVLGVITWDQFKGMEPAERHRLIRERVRNKLGLSGMNVGVLFPLAPGEKL